MFMPYFPPPRLRAWRRSRCWRCDCPMNQWHRMMWWCGNCGLLYTYSYRLDDGRL